MKVALIGNPNSGKTSLFNKLTGSNQKIGNWPGVTTQKKEGTIAKTNITLVDLPGVYSLSPYTEEECVSREFLLKEKPDVVVDIIDATSLERSLFLTTQILDLGLNVVLALNMTDLLDKKGIKLNEKELSESLGVRAIKTSAKTGLGIDSLVSELKNKRKHLKKQAIYPKIIDDEIEIFRAQNNLENKFLAIEQLENNKKHPNNRSRQVIEKILKTDIEQGIANEKYNFISKVRDKCVNKQLKKETITEKLDKVILNKWVAIPIFAVVMSLMYVLSVGVVGKFTSQFLNECFGKFGDWIQQFLTKWGASDWAVSLVVNGIISGIGSVLSFAPQLVVIFLCISVLETSGYMSRISFIFDRLFRNFGLSGKSLVPFIVGTGCSVPAIAATKPIEQKQEKEMTVILSPFVPCSAKLPIISLFVGYFFPNNNGIVTASLYFLSIFVILLSAIILKKFVYKNKETSFISELPEYKTPSLKYIFKDVVDKTKDFVKRAGTVVVFCSVVVWFLSSFSWKFQFIDKIENSILAWIGNLFGWFFYPIVGEWNWAVSISAMQGLIAKEQVVSSMSVIANVASFGNGGSIFGSSIFSGFSELSGYAFVVFNLFSAPCIASIGAMKFEFKNRKKLFLALAFQIAIAWVLASMIFLVGSIFV